MAGDPRYMVPCDVFSLSSCAGHLSNVLQVNYVYILCLVCGMVIFMIPLVAFPRAVSPHSILSSPPAHSAKGGHLYVIC